MPANILDTDNMAYKGAVPWHGLGVPVPEGTSGEEMLNLAGLNWRVQRRMLAMPSADRKKSLTAELAKFRAIVRQDTDYVFAVATQDYFPVQNEQVVGFFREYCEAGEATMETVGSLCNGAVIWALARLNGGSTAVIGDGLDELRGYLLLATSHDKSLCTIGKPTQTRVVCWNTLTAALREKNKSEFKIKHTRKWTPEIVAEAKGVMGMAIEQVQAANEIAAVLSKIGIDQKGREDFVRVLVEGQIPDVIQFTADGEQKFTRVEQGILEAIDACPGSDMVSAKNTLWGAVNGVTYYVDFVRGRTVDNRLANAWFKQGDTMKREAVTVARKMAGVN